jgi:hypothetical protein
MNPPEENATFQEHLDWVIYKYWRRPLAHFAGNYLGPFLLWLLNLMVTIVGEIANRFEDKEDDRK